MTTQLPERYPVAISASIDNGEPLIVAVCNDGTLWDYWSCSKEWCQLPAIPPPPPQETP